MESLTAQREKLAGSLSRMTLTRGELAGATADLGVFAPLAVGGPLELLRKMGKTYAKRIQASTQS